MRAPFAATRPCIWGVPFWAYEKMFNKSAKNLIFSLLVFRVPNKVKSHSTYTLMKKIASLILSVALASSAFAGAPAYSGKGGKIVNPPAPSCDWFAPGAKLGIFGGGFIPDGAKSGDDALGGGVLAEYFFCENFGLEGSYGAYATDATHHEFDLNLIARYPMKNGCWAPYLLIGGGYSVNSDNQWNWGLGGGAEIHLTGNIGAFADGAYHWGENDNFTLIRLGLKFRL
jgi:hypothetical protein